MEESVIIQGIIAVSFVLTTCYMAATGRQIPEIIATALTFVLGYFFGQKSQQAVAKTVKRLKRNVDNTAHIGSGDSDSSA